MTKGHSKGSSFEREICKKLSLWWTYGKREDVFWRTAGSGAMAKTRSKTNRSAFGQYGDIQATDPIGQPLIDLFSIELKRGYSKDTFANLIDKPNNAAKQVFEKFIEQAMADSILGKTYSWMLITKRNAKKAMIFTPLANIKELKHRFSKDPKVMIAFKNSSDCICKIFGIPLNTFLERVKPSFFKNFIKKEAQANPITYNATDDGYDKTTRHRCLVCEAKESVIWTGSKFQCENCKCEGSHK